MSTNAVTLSLKSLLVPSKTVEVEFPGMPDFKITVSFQSRESMINLRKKATKTTLKNRQTVDEVDDELFLKLYVEACIKDWKGLKLSYLDQLAPVDLSGQDLEATLGFSQDNALWLMKASTIFDQFISDTVTDLGKFPSISSTK